MKLYEINKQYLEILESLEDDEGNINTHLLGLLEENKLQLEQKSIDLAYYIKNIEAEKEAVGKAKQQMLDRERRLSRKIESLESYLLNNMEIRNITKISCPYFEIKVRVCPPSVNVVDEILIPDDYKRVKTEISLDRAKMLSEMKVGVVIPGAEIKRNRKLNIS